MRDFLRRNFLFIRVMLLALCLIAAGESLAGSRQRTLWQGIVQAEGKVNVRSAPNMDGQRIGTLSPGTMVDLLEEIGGWYAIDFDGKRGYVNGDFLQVSTWEEVEFLPDEPPLELILADVTTPTLLKVEEKSGLSGQINSNVPILRATLQVYRENLMDVEWEETLRFAYEDQITQLELADFALAKKRLSSGEKRLILTLESLWEECVALERGFAVLGKAAAPIHMTRACTVSLEGAKDQAKSVTIELPESPTAGALVVEWTSPVSACRIQCLDGHGELLSDWGSIDRQAQLTHFFPLNPKARTIRLTSLEDGAIRSLTVYAQDQIPSQVQAWAPLPHQVDLMVFSAHQDDEFLFFGGAIPDALAQRKSVAVVYMANCGRSRYAEALAGLWAAGLRHHPIFLGLPDRNIQSYPETLQLWEDKSALSTVIALIRQYQPQVIITHGPQGEYGHNQHKLTFAYLAQAVEQAADPSIDPDSAEQWGTWAVPKLYAHLYPESIIHLDWSIPLDLYDGRTALDMATLGYDQHRSQHEAYTMSIGKRYDSTWFGLVHSTVGADVEGGNFFENLP